MKWLLLSLLCIISLNQAVYADVNSAALFVDASNEQQAHVELFEFHSPSLQQQAISLAKSLRCPQCQNQNLIESTSPIALDLRLTVFEMINQGQSEQQVIDYMTARYGEFVLYQPKFSTRNALLWGLPVLMLLIFILRSVIRIKK